MSMTMGPRHTGDEDGRLSALRVQGRYLPLCAAAVLVVGGVHMVMGSTLPGRSLACVHAVPLCALNLTLIVGYGRDQRSALRVVRGADTVLVVLSLIASLCLFLIVVATLRLAAAWDVGALTAYSATLGLSEVLFALRWFSVGERRRLAENETPTRIVWRRVVRHLASAALYVLSADTAFLAIPARVTLIALGVVITLMATFAGQP